MRERDAFGLMPKWIDWSAVPPDRLIATGELLEKKLRDVLANHYPVTLIQSGHDMVRAEESCEKALEVLKLLASACERRRKAAS